MNQAIAELKNKFQAVNGLEKIRLAREILEARNSAKSQPKPPEPSAIFGDDDLNPNSPNYRYKDTGYIAGSKKELAARAAEFIKKAAKDGDLVRASAIDFDSIEDNPREAKALITKQNLLGKIDWQKHKDNGMSPAAAFLIDRILFSISKEPAQDTPQARRDFAIGIETIKDRLEQCKTVSDVILLITEIQEESVGIVLTAEESEQYKILYAQYLEKYAIYEEALKKWRDEKYKVDILITRIEVAKKDISQAKSGWSIGRRISKDDAQKIINYSQNSISNYEEALAKAQRDFSKYEQAHPEISVSKKFTYFDGEETYSEVSELYFEQENAKRKADAIKKSADKRNAEEGYNNQATRSWKTFGKSFDKLLQWRYGGTFHGHVQNARKGNPDNWDWAKLEPKPKDETESKTDTGEKGKTRFQLKVSDSFERVGGRSVNVSSTIELKNMFGLRDVQSGNYVLKDKSSAEFHVKQSAAAFADLADLIGVPDHLISMKGNLAMAFGARGSGSALAHYEPVQRVINITKMKGGGSLAHEWFHAMDNMMAEVFSGKSVGVDTFLTQTPEKITSPELTKAFRGLKLAMLEGNTRATQIIEYSANDYKTGKLNFENATYGVKLQIKETGNAQDAAIFVNDNQNRLKNWKTWLKIAVAYFDGKPEGGVVEVPSGMPVSKFLADAIKLDMGKSGRYWSKSLEMAARAFSAWVEDRLGEQGRKNHYLSNHSSNDVYEEEKVYPFPAGEERVRINKAFDELFKAIRETNALQVVLDSIWGDDIVFDSVQDLKAQWQTASGVEKIALAKQIIDERKNKYSENLINTPLATESEYHFKEAQSAYQHSNRSAAFAFRESYVKSINENYEKLNVRLNPEQKYYLDSEFIKLKSEYLEQEKRVFAFARNQVSAHIAGGSKFKASLATRGETGKQKVENDFYRWFDGRILEIEQGISKLRSNEQINADNETEKNAKFKKALNEFVSNISYLSVNGYDKNVFREAAKKSLDNLKDIDIEKTKEQLLKVDSVLIKQGKSLMQVIGNKSKLWKEIEGLTGLGGNEKPKTQPLNIPPDDGDDSVEIMTKAQWAKIPKDYKSIDNRKRSAMIFKNGSSMIKDVFLSDSKVVLDDTTQTTMTISQLKNQFSTANGMGKIALAQQILELRGLQNAAATNDLLERDSDQAGNENRDIQKTVFNERNPDRTSTGRTRQPISAVGNTEQSNPSLSTDSPVTGRERGNPSVGKRDGEFKLSAGTANGSGSPESGGSGIQPDRESAIGLADAVRESKNLDREEKARLQLEAERLDSVFNNEASIRADLPYLLPEQQDDIVKIEKRLADANGMMITNGTGTGKTATALGTVKRFIKQGKNNILIVVPGDKIAQDFVDFGKNLHLTIKKLESIQDNGGSGIGITTYANFYQNESLMRREWDLVVFDEAHKINSNQAGDNTDAQSMMRKITNHKNGLGSKARYLAAKELGYNHEDLTDDDDERRITLFNKVDEIRENLSVKKSKVLFLSATPFAYEKSIDYAEGYLFDYGEGGDGYNSGGGYERFMMQHFGYTMRYNRLTTPDAGVNSGAMQRQFNEWLKNQGALSGRALQVEADYSREFIILKDRIGEQIDSGISALRDGDSFRSLSGYINRTSFDYLSKLKLLEAIKAKALIKRIRKHLALNRKVVLFHSYKVSGAGNPFSLNTEHKEWNLLKPEEKQRIKSEYALFSAKYPQFVNLNLDDLESPINTMKKAFGSEVMIYNGDIPKKQILQHANDFNDDSKNRDIILMQVDKGKEGVSLHDTTGKKTRVLINLGLPTKPTDSIQIEGRIYRTGQVSNAIFEYISTGTQFEKRVFSQIIAERSSTAENLALGSNARNLLQAFTEGYLNATDSEPSENQGTGGKQYNAVSELSVFEKAKSDYFATQKANKYTKSKGVDYFPTPEPIGLKMVELANIAAGESALEPSAGHGAIARYFPENSKNTFIEPSTELTGDLSLRTAGSGEIKNTTFEDLDKVNKYNAIVMNPPFGKGGSTAIEHLAKATKHLRDAGRIVALLPKGGMADKKLAKFLSEAGKNDIRLVAEIFLPTVAFERSGTSVASQIIVLDRIDDEEQRDQVYVRTLDFRHITDISELFDDMQNSLSSLPRPISLVEKDKAKSPNA